MNKPEVPNVPVMKIDDVSYAMSDLNATHQGIVAQIKDLEEQLRLNEFKHQQLIHGRMAYITELKNSLENPDGSKPK